MSAVPNRVGRPRTFSDEQLVTLHTELGSNRAAAKALGVDESAVRWRINRLIEQGIEIVKNRKGRPKKSPIVSGGAAGNGVPAIEITQPKPDGLGIDELIELRCELFKRKQIHEQQRALIPVKVNMAGPIGIFHFGDPHVDDDGCDLPTLRDHINLILNTPGMFAANVGDTTNNWVGRLAALYAEQGTTAEEAWMLAEWFIGSLSGKWIYMIGGNHDLWSGHGDPLKWISRQAGALYQSSECRLELQFPNDARVRINARHDFSGHSIYNPAHGAMKAAAFGARDHILICGHKHVSGYGILKCPMTGIMMHSIQVASYKVYDRYARTKGFRDQNLSPCVVTIIDPHAAKESGLVQVFHDPELGARTLTMMRREYEQR